jgi:hypothetical protein
MVNKLNEEICNGPIVEKGNSIQSDPVMKGLKINKRKEQ